MAMTIFLRFCEATLGCLFLSWLLFGACILAMLLAGIVAVTRAGDARARRVFLTARLSLGLSASLFLVVTLIFWAGFVFAAERVIPYDTLCPRDADLCVSRTTLCFTPELMGSGTPVAVRNLSTKALSFSGVLYLACLFGLLLVSGLIGGWVFIPSVITEYKSPVSGEGRTRLGRSRKLARPGLRQNVAGCRESGVRCGASICAASNGRYIHWRSLKPQRKRW